MPSSVENSVTQPCTSLGALALARMRERPADEICQISVPEREARTVDEMCSYIHNMALHLRQMRLGESDIVGIIAPNTHLLMPTVIACWYNCNVVHFVNPQHEESTIKHLFSITKPKVIFCDGADYDKIKRATEPLKPRLLTLCNHIDKVEQVCKLMDASPSIKGEELYPSQLSKGASQTVAIICSSGTTGPPKCVTISQERLVANSDALPSMAVWFSFSTPDWFTGLLYVTLSALKGGTRIIATEPFSPEYMLNIIDAYKVNFLSASTRHLHQILRFESEAKSALKTIQLIVMTGSRCSASNMERIRQLLPPGALLFNAYGISEFGGIANTCLHNKPNSVGKILPDIELEIRDQIDGKPLPINTVGEIHVRSKRQWQGYYGDPEATAAAMDSKGWINTGDLGYIDEERDLFLVDRSKDTLKFEGLQYSPQEIERTIEELEGVEEVCVFGVNDDDFGDLAAAAIVKKLDNTLTEEEVKQHVAVRQQQKAKHLKYGVFFVQQIPKNFNGKVMRKQVKEMCLGMEKNSKL